LLSGNDYIYTNSYNRTLIDPNLKPERKTSYEAGADIRFFNNRLGLDLTLYKENTRDQIVNIPAPLESGANGQLINAGNIENKGIELALNTTPLQTQSFKWDLNFIYTKNKNKIISLHKDVGEYKNLEGDPAYGNYRIGSVAYIGGEYGVLLSDALPETYHAVDAQGNKIDSPNNGKKVLLWVDTRKGAYYKRSGKIQKVGTMLPDFEGSVVNNFSFKNFSLNILVDMRFGGKIASYSNRYGTAYGYMKESLFARDKEHGGISWVSQYPQSKGQTFEDGVIPDAVFATGTMVTTPSGERINVGGMTYQDAYSKGYVEPTHSSYWTYRNYSWGTGIVDDSWVSDVNYVALRHISLGYNVPQKFSSRLKLNNVYIGLDGHNLGYLYNSLPNHLMPESTRGNSSSYSYFERVLTPYVASYTFTLKLNF
jgi:iron complex outermembrane receptor protein